MRRPFTSHLVLTAAILIGAGPYIVKAASSPAPHAAPQEGPAMVDLMRVYGESDTRKAADQKIEEYGKLMGQRFDEIAGMSYLNATEIRDYSDALTAEKPTDADKQKMATIKAESTKRAAEAQALIGRKDSDLTAADRMRLRDLTAMREQQPSIMGQLQRLYQQLVNNKDTELTRLGVAEVRVIVGKLAKEQGFTQVFDTTAMVYAPTDLTQAALAKVKKK